MRANVSAVESESLAVMDASHDEDTDAEETERDSQSLPYASAQVLSAQFRRTRILCGSVAIAGVVTAALILLQDDGVLIETFEADDKSDQERKQLLDYYNSVSGSVGSLVAKPIELFLGLLASVAFLCFATDFALASRSKDHWKHYLLLAAPAALSYLFSSGINSLNVQIASGTLSVRIAPNDLSIAQSTAPGQSLFANGSLRTAWDRSFAENASENSVFNTILRTSSFPIEEVKSLCAFPLEAEQEPLPSVTFGFPSRSWHPEVLSKALAPTASLKIAMGAKDPSAELEPNASLPMSTASANNLVIYGIHVLTGLKLGNDSYTLQAGSFSNKPKPRRVADFYNLSASSSEASTPSTTRSFLDASNALWLKALTNMNNLVLADTTVEYTRTKISEQLTYDAVTFELPVKYATTVTTGADSYLGVGALISCSREGCLLPAPLSNVSAQTRVQAANICVDDAGTEDITIFLDEDHDAYATPCNRTSNTSMLVVSVGKRMEGELWDKFDGDLKVTDDSIRFKNLRTVYSITIGRLSWELEDLARVFGAGCRAGVSCDGLRHKLQPNSSRSEYLLVGKDSLPLARLSRVNLGEFTKTKWRALVTLWDIAPASRRFDIALPRRFSRITPNGLSVRTGNASRCFSSVDDLIIMVEKNHLYMEQSLQTSYTAAFYFLFQNAVRHQRVNATASSDGAAETPVPLAFAGNKQMLNVQISIPTTNAVVSLVGCVLLLLMSVGVVARASQSERVLQQRANAEVVTEAVMSSDKYPPSLLKMALEQQTAFVEPSEEEKVSVPLQDLRVVNVVFRRANEPELQDQSKPTVFQVGPAS